MKNHVITITRQFGSMGRPIGKLVAEELGFKYFDRDILEKTAEKMDVSFHSLLHWTTEVSAATTERPFPWA